MINMKWLFVIDPIKELNHDTDSTYAIMKESFKLEIEIFICRIQDLFYKNEVWSICTPVIFKLDNYVLGPKKTLALNSFNLIFMRRDPPYDLKYHYALLLLSLTTTKVINSPQAIRDFNEKLTILRFRDLIPETIVTSNITQIKDFLKSHENLGIIIKSLDSYQGKSVFKLNKFDNDCLNLLNRLTNGFNSPIMVQEYLPEIKEGDKRILVLGGEIIGTILRVPKENNFLANLGQGSKAVKTRITKRDKHIVQELSDFLMKNGLHFVGLDVIGNYLTEINVTCPTGILQYNSLNNATLETKIVNYFLNLI